MRTFEAAVGSRRGDVVARVRELEVEAGTRFKRVRGLATLLERRCAFEMATRLDPARTRRVVWTLAAQDGPVTTPERREAVLAAAARELDATPRDVEAALEADAEENLVLVRVDAPAPESLLRAYNVALAQTLLFDAVEVEVEVGRHFRGVFQAVKREGLMHVLERLPDGRYRMTLDGPASALRQTRRYGSAMAKLVPSLRAAAPWRLLARIQERARPGEAPPPERVFEVDSESLPFPADALDLAPDDAPAVFDSRVEQRFAEAFRALRGGWRLEREPALLEAGASVLVPDFGFAYGPGPCTVFLEIVGYWTPRYLERKLAKVRALPPGTDLLLAVDRSLGAAPEALADLGERVLWYDGEVPLAEVAHALAARAADAVEAEAARLVEAGLPPGEVVVLDRWAAAHGASREAAERALVELGTMGRERVGNALVAPAALAAAAAELAEGMTVAEAEARLAKRGLADASSALARLGWRAEWRGLDASSAILRRAEPGPG